MRICFVDTVPGQRRRDLTQYVIDYSRRQYGEEMLILELFEEMLSTIAKNLADPTDFQTWIDRRTQQTLDGVLLIDEEYLKYINTYLQPFLIGLREKGIKLTHTQRLELLDDGEIPIYLEGFLSGVNMASTDPVYQSWFKANG